MSVVVSSTKRRRPAVAAILNAIVPGLGYLYAQRPRLAFVYAGLGPLIPVAAIYSELHRTFAGAVAFVALLAVMIVGAPIHAAYVCIVSENEPAAPRLRRWLLTLCLLGVSTAWVMVRPELGRRLVATLCARAITITSDSMRPTLVKGDLIVVDACQPEAPPNGSLVMFTMPDNPRGTMIKRVVASGNETIQVTATSVLVDGRVHTDLPVALPNVLYGPVSVPANAIFVLGDNLSNSLDSRHFGPVPHSLILGRPLYVLATTHGPLGRSLR